MSIEVVVGLPHLSNGAILARAAALQVPALISANCLSRWSTRRGWLEWLGWRLRVLQNARSLHSLRLDSAGFVATRLYGRFPWTIDEYFQLAASFPFLWFASFDYCTEPEIASDRDEVLDRVSRTIRANMECRLRADDLGMRATLLPVLQGRHPDDYERCADGLWLSMVPGTIIGVGSMCRREIGGPEGVVAVVERLHRVLPTGVLLHLFGVKGAALPYLLPFEGRVASIDSQAYGIAARQDALRRGEPKTDLLVADHLEAWVNAQRVKLAGPPAKLVTCPEPPRTWRRADPWSAAIAQARAEIRELVEAGELDFGLVSPRLVEEWAGDIYHDVREAA